MQLLQREQIDNSPSRKCGISAADETSMRKGACIFMQHAGVLLKFPQITTATAIVLFHLFFSRRSFSHYDRFVIATTSLYLAAKIAESPRKIRDIVNVVYAILNNKTLSISNEYWDLKDVVVKIESVVLRTLAFELTIDLPYHYLLNYCNAVNVHPAFVQVALCIMNDSLISTVCLQYKPHEIACACIYLAAKFLNVHVPHGSERTWWQAFDGNIDHIEGICSQVLELYENGLNEEIYSGTQSWMKLVDRNSNDSTPVKSAPQTPVSADSAKKKPQQGDV